METSLHHLLDSRYRRHVIRISPWNKLIAWASTQEPYRFGWAVLSIAGHVCVFTLLTTLTILLSGNHFIFWPFAILAIMACLVVNLAALPTRVTIPVLFVSLLVDLLIICACIGTGVPMNFITP